MILSDDPVDLRSLAGGLRMLVELATIQHPPGARAQDVAPDVFAETRAVFRQHVKDNHDRENAIRRALCYVLNLDDAGLDAFALAGRMPFPNRDVAQKRAFLESLWADAFADWRVDDFDPEAFAKIA